jgi:pimeloyl-ACP methyl ester carboxylesterase
VKRQFRRGFGVVGVTALVALAIGLYPRVFGRKRLRFTYLTGEIAPAEYQRAAARPGWSASHVTVAPGIKLMGLVRRPTNKDAPWVLYYPGNDATQLERGQAFLSHLNEGQDWGLAVFAYRGYDSSDGVPQLSDLAEDAPNILLQLCANEHIVPDRVHMVGFSIGGHLAVRAVDALVLQNRPPHSLSLLACVDDIVMVRRSFYEKLDAGDDYQTRPFLDGVRAPVLVLQGAADETLGGPSQGQAIAKALGDRAKYVELPGVGHNVLINTDAAVVQVRAFIASHAE